MSATLRIRRPAGPTRKLRADREAVAATVERLSADISAQRAFAASCGRETSFVYLELELAAAQRRLAALDAEIARREVRR